MQRPCLTRPTRRAVLGATTTAALCAGLVGAATTAQASPAQPAVDSSVFVFTNLYYGTDGQPISSEQDNTNDLSFVQNKSTQALPDQRLDVTFFDVAGLSASTFQLTTSSEDQPFTVTGRTAQSVTGYFGAKTGYTIPAATQDSTGTHPAQMRFPFQATVSGVSLRAPVTQHTELVTVDSAGNPGAVTQQQDDVSASALQMPVNGYKQVPVIRRGNTFFYPDAAAAGAGVVGVRFGSSNDVPTLTDAADGYNPGTSPWLDSFPTAVRPGTNTFYRPSRIQRVDASTLAVTAANSQTQGVTGDRVLQQYFSQSLLSAADQVRLSTAPAFFRPSNLVFYFERENVANGRTTGVQTQVAFGSHGDIPLTGNWDGTSADGIGVYRPSTATFYLRENDGTVLTVPFGAHGDTPIVGRWTGDGRTYVGVRRGSTFYLATSNARGAATLAPFRLGYSSDTVVGGGWANTGADLVRTADANSSMTVPPAPLGQARRG